MERTFIIAVEVPDVFPAVMAYDVDDSESVEWSNKDLKLSTFTPATHTHRYLPHVLLGLSAARRHTRYM